MCQNSSHTIHDTVNFHRACPKPGTYALPHHTISSQSSINALLPLTAAERRFEEGDRAKKPNSGVPPPHSPSSYSAAQLKAQETELLCIQSRMEATSPTAATFHMATFDPITVIQMINTHIPKSTSAKCRSKQQISYSTLLRRVRK
jgi:hypothetical protein